MTPELALMIALVYSMIISGLYIKEMFDHATTKFKFERMKKTYESRIP
jgi:hypothetical protein